MQVFRLVKGGHPDRVIAFDTLPQEYVQTLRMNPPAGLPRHWSRWLEENGSVDKDGKAGFYILDYIMTNNDKQAWQNIVNYTRRVVDTGFRLMDHLEDMAKPLANDARAEIVLEPEDIVVIPIPADAPDAEPAVAAAPRTKGRKAKETSNG